MIHFSNEDNSHALKTRKLNDENHRSQKVPPVFAEKKKYEKPKKKTDKVCLIFISIKIK